MSKTPDDYFRDWEGEAFGFGYGTGEPYIIPALKRFIELVPVDGYYDYRVLERELTPAVAWLLINVLCRESMLEYGTSPRGAWFTPAGKRLQEYILAHTADELLNTLERDEDYAPCYSDACNCGPNGYDKNRKCPNPFFDRGVMG